ncbi:MAG: hypothetical protein H8E37_09560, partial [Planctomycetes bacterium]|nr:hypothetical protein [Planctomycetota bacterium]
MDYRPQPIDTSSVELSPEILDLVERLAANAHADWVARLVASGWTAGPEIDDEQKTHPGLTAYEELPEHEKQSLRHNVQATLKAILANGYQVTLRSPVIWLHRARCRVQEENIAGWNSELKSVFQDATASQLTVSDVFSGFSNDEVQRIVLGVQWKSSTANGSHIVKIGTSSEVGTDFEGWKRCVLQGGMSSRILPDVSAHELPDDRFAVVYEDAYRILGTDPDAESPRWLETAVNWAIRDSKPDVLSVESVLTQVFGELDRCLYAGARSGTERAAEFYRTALKKAGRQTEMSALECWQFDTHLNRRRDALWLITSRDEPIKPQPRRYLDPVDFLTWALENGRVPETLAGRAHGDLHGRNVLVGVVRGTAQQPVVIDYGDMADDNLLVWDFVKLECELKTRIAPALFSEPGAREALSNVALLVRPPARNRQPALAGELQDAADCADRMEFAFQFEHVLNGMTARIISRHEAETPLSEERRRMTGHTALDKALCLLHRIRQEASLSLGYRLGRSQHWRDEHLFAFCAYGVFNAKRDGERPQLEGSLTYAGAA